MGTIMTGCSNDDNELTEPLQPTNTDNVVTLTATIGFDDNATTRALSSTGEKTFAVGDQIAVCYKYPSGSWVLGNSNALTADDIKNDGKSATITVNVSSQDYTKPVAYVYPAGMVKNVTFSDIVINYDKLAKQYGSLEKIGSELDYCMKEGSWDGESLPSLTLENQLAICAFTIKNSNGDDITSTIKYLTISDGTNKYTINRYPMGEGPIYVAIRPTSAANIEFTAWNEKNTKMYTKSLTGKTYEAGGFYNLKWRMTKEYTIGHVICTDGSTYETKSAAEANSKTPVAMIAYLGYETGYDQYNHGLAFALSDEDSKMNWETANNTCTNKTPTVTNAVWMLHNQNHMNKIGNACKDNGNSFEGINQKLENCGGTAFIKKSDSSDGKYWSSKMDGDKHCTMQIFADGSSLFWEATATDEYLVRACLAF